MSKEPANKDTKPIVPVDEEKKEPELKGCAKVVNGS